VATTPACLNPTKIDGTCYIKNRRAGAWKNSILLPQMRFLVNFPLHERDHFMTSYFCKCFSFLTFCGFYKTKQNMSSNPSQKKNAKLLKEADDASGGLWLLKPAAHPDPAKNKSGLQSAYWLFVLQIRLLKFILPFFHSCLVSCLWLLLMGIGALSVGITPSNIPFVDLLS
jgi:hypothetical protein